MSLTGTKRDFYKPRKPHVPESLHRKRIAREFEQSEKILLNGEQVAVRRLALSFMPYQLIRGMAHNYRVLDCWRYAENPDVLVVREKFTRELIGVLDAATLRETTDAVASSYTQALIRFRLADEAVQEVGGDLLVSARRQTQQELSAASLQVISSRND